MALLEEGYASDLEIAGEGPATGANAAPVLPQQGDIPELTIQPSMYGQPSYKPFPAIRPAVPGENNPAYDPATRGERWTPLPSNAQRILPRQRVPRDAAPYRRWSKEANCVLPKERAPRLSALLGAVAVVAVGVFGSIASVPAHAGPGSTEVAAVKECGPTGGHSTATRHNVLGQAATSTVEVCGHGTDANVALVPVAWQPPLPPAQQLSPESQPVTRPIKLTPEQRAIIRSLHISQSTKDSLAKMILASEQADYDLKARGLNIRVDWNVATGQALQEGIGPLCSTYNNCYGMKYNPKYATGRINMGTWEFEHGRHVKTSADFMSFPTLADGLAMYALQLEKNFPNALGHVGNDRLAVRGIRRWATDPNYLNEVLAHIRDYHIAQLFAASGMKYVDAVNKARARNMLAHT